MPSSVPHYDKAQIAARMMNTLHSRDVRHEAYDLLMMIEWFEAVHERGYQLSLVPPEYRDGVYRMLSEHLAPPAA